MRNYARISAPVTFNLDISGENYGTHRRRGSNWHRFICSWFFLVAGKGISLKQLVPPAFPRKPPQPFKAVVCYFRGNTWVLLKIQSSPKCKAWKKFASIRYADCLLTPLRRAAYG
jgi:hypothetical protein